MGQFGSLVQEYYVNKFRKNAELRRKKIAAITSAAAAEKFVAETKAKVRGVFNFPKEKCPLNPVVTSTVDHPCYTVEKVIYYSRPNFPVTAHLFIPKNLTAKAPAMVVLCGHAFEGKAAETYQMAASTYAIAGAVALVIDPIAQGERTQYKDQNDPQMCAAHNCFNRQLLPIGEHFGEWRAWDAIRGIDYLLTRPEVDASRIGINGNSGGGTMTAIVNALEDRAIAAAPSCYITRWLNNVENEEAVDAEQIPPYVAANGGDMADLLLAVCPRPVMIMAKTDDFFDVRGSREIYEELKHIYGLLGYADRVELSVGVGPHGYTQNQRIPAYSFFAKHLGFTSFNDEPKEAVALTGQSGWVTKNGTTYDIENCQCLKDFIPAKVAECQANRPKLSATDLREKLSAALNIPEVICPTYRQLRPGWLDANNVTARYALETEPGMLAVLHYAKPQVHYSLPAMDKVELYIPHQSALDEIVTRPIGENTTLFGLNYRGIGESKALGYGQHPSSQDFFAPYASDYAFATYGLLLGESYLGRRVYDVLCAIELIASNGAKEITITCSGIGAIPALLAAVLTPHKVKFVPDEKITTFAENCLNHVPDYPQSMILEGILKFTDVDELLELVK